MSVKTIWKFSARMDDHVTVELPRGAEVLSTQVIGCVLYVWAIVMPGGPVEARRFEIRGTGHPLGEVGRHLSTSVDGPFVWHVFEALS